MTAVRVTINRIDTADTAITAELQLSLPFKSFSMSPGTEGLSVVSAEIDTVAIL